MSKYLFTQLFIFLLTTTTIVISQDKNNARVARADNDDNQLKTSITCLCTSDEQCDGDSRTCKLTHPHHSCYESWTLEPSDGSIHVSAGYASCSLAFFRYSIGILDACIMTTSSFD